MIFSELFQSAHKSKDPQKRLSGIDKLDPSKEKDKAVLHELAFNDGNDDVSIQALKKLDSFILWMKALETFHATKVKNYAFETCLTQLELEDKVSHDLFESFVLESKNKPLLEKLLFSSNRLRKHRKLSLNVLNRLDNENQTRRYFQERASKEQQLELIESESEIKILNRYYKLTQSDEVRTTIENKLKDIELAKQKPIKVKQQATLINARLLALKDAIDYEYLQNNFEELVKEFEELKHDFGCLDEITAATFIEKYLSLKTALQQKLNDLEIGYKKQLVFKQTTSLLSELSERCKEVEHQINLLVKHSQSAQQSGDELSLNSQVKILDNSLQTIFNELESIEPTDTTNSHHKSISDLNAKINNLQEKLNNIPKIITAATEIAQQIEQLNNFINITNEQHEDSKGNDQTHDISTFEQQLFDNKQSLHNLKKEYGNLLPVNLIREFESLIGRLNKIKNSINQEQKQKERKIESKLKVINNLITQGKYRPALSMFYNIELLYNNIQNTASIRLQKNFQNTLEEISKLKDWQAYIALPRKPELVEQAKKLISTTSSDLYERAEQIKKLRQEYSSFGNLHTPEDDELNEKFNTYIEQAFTPCREFFADLEKIREENYKKAVQLIELIENTQIDLPHAELVTLSNQFKKQFVQLGDIDKKHKSRVKRDFNKALKPINRAIADAIAENARLKANLLKQIETICETMNEESFNIQNAVDIAKEIQQKWKNIGFAGKSTDNELWQKFRAINDILFNRYHDSMSKKKSQNDEQLNEITQLAQNHTLQITNAESIADLSFYDNARANLLVKVEQLDDKNTKVALKQINALENQYDQTAIALNKQKEQHEMSNLFSFLESYQSTEINENDLFNALSSKHKSWIVSYKSSEDLLNNLNRLQLAQAATILFNKQFNEIPLGDEESRKEIQLKIMASKLEGGESLSPETILATWVSCGPILEEDKESFDVIKLLYLKS